jgi:ATP-dependent helicase HrpA
LTNAEKLTLGHNPHASVPALLQDCLDAAVDDIVRGRVGGEVRDSTAFAEALNAVRTHAASKVLLVVRAVLPILTEAAAVQSRLTALEAAQGRLPAYVSVTLADVRAQYDSLIRPGFVADTGSLRLPDLLRYLKAMNHRLERAATTAREPDLQRQIDEVEAAYAAWLESLNPRARRGPAARDIGWMIEELRVSLFAQVLGTAHSVSAKRIRAAMTAATP